MNDLINTEINNPPLATARLLGAVELPKELDYNPANDFFLGATADGRLLGTHPLDDTHILCDAGTRGDKGVYFSSTLLHIKSSLVWTSTKFQDVYKIAERRGSGGTHADGMGQACFVWDGHGYFQNGELAERNINAKVIAINPIGGEGGFVDPTKPNCVARAKRVAKCVKPEHAGDNEKDYFGKACRSMGSMGIVHIASAPEFEGRRDFGTLYDCLLEGDVKTWETLRDLDLLDKDEAGNIIATPHDVWQEGMKQNKACDNFIAKQSVYFEKMLKRAGEQYEGVIGELLTALSFLDDPTMRKSMSETSFDLSRIKCDPQGVSLLIPRKEGQEDIDAVPVRLIFAMCEEEMKQPGKPATGQQTVFWCDEFSSMGFCDTILNGLASLAGHGVKFCFIVQTLAQLELVYKKEGVQIFLSGCLTRVFFDIRSTYDAELIQKMAGEKEVLIINRSASQAVAESETEHFSDTKGSGRGTHRSGSSSQGGSKQQTYNGSIFSPVVPLMFKKLWNTSAGGNWSLAKTDGENDSTNESHTEGGGTSATRTKTGTLVEQRQVRPLLPVNEVMQNYGKLRTDGKRVALVQICGIGWFECNRLRYWEHEIWFRCFGDDGEHKFLQAPKPRRVVEQENRQAIEAAEEKRRLAEIEYDNSLAGRAANSQQLHDLNKQEDLSLTATGMQVVSGAAVLIFLGVGAPLVAIVGVACFFASRQWKKSFVRRSERVRELKQRIGTSKHGSMANP